MHLPEIRKYPKGEEKKETHGFVEEDDENFLIINDDSRTMPLVGISKLF